MRAWLELFASNPIACGALSVVFVGSVLLYVYVTLGRNR